MALAHIKTNLIGPLIFTAIGSVLIALVIFFFIQTALEPADIRGEDFGPLLASVFFGLPGIAIGLPGLIILIKRLAQNRKQQVSR